MKTADKAKAVINRVTAGEPVQQVKHSLSTDAAEWGRISVKAYRVWLDGAKKKRPDDLRDSRVAAISNEAIDEIISINVSVNSVASFRSIRARGQCRSRSTTTGVSDADDEATTAERGCLPYGTQMGEADGPFPIPRRFAVTKSRLASAWHVATEVSECPLNGFEASRQILRRPEVGPGAGFKRAHV
jgi:hypothetical protein